MGQGRYASNEKSLRMSSKKKGASREATIEISEDGMEDIMEPGTAPVSLYDTILEQMHEKEFVLFVPTTNRGLKHDYPELGDVDRSPEFMGIRKNDMDFVWAWACASSPFAEIEDRERKLKLCCRYAYPVEKEQQRLRDFAVRFPEDIATGIVKMGRYNKTARIEEYLALRTARNNYKMILAQDITGAGPKERKEWLEQSLIAQKGLDGQRERMEGGALGIREAKETLIQDAVDLLSLYHESIN